MTESKFGFSLGDQVIFIADGDPDHGVVYGQRGIVVDFDNCSDDMVGVQWDDRCDKFHDCNGKSKQRHGWYVPIDQIEVYIEMEAPEIDSSFLDDALAEVVL